MKVQNRLNFRGTFQLLFAIGCCIPLLTFSSCQQDNDEDWSPIIAAPLVNSTMSVSDLLEQLTMDSIFDVNATGLLSLNFQSELFDYKPTDVLNFNYGASPIIGAIENTPALEMLINQNGEHQLALPTSVFAFNPEVQNEDGSNFEVKIDSLYLYESAMIFNFSSDFGHAGRIDIEIPHLFDSEGNHFDESIEWSESPDEAISDAKIFDLDGYFLDMTKSEESDTIYNRFDIDVSVVIMNTIPNYDIEDDASLDFTVEIADMNFELAYGDFGSGNFPLGKDTIEFNPFEEFSDADFYLADPTITLEINSGIGLQNMNSFVQQLVYIDTDGNENEVLFNPTSVQPTLTAPTVVGETVTTFSKLTNEDGYISELLSPTEKDLVYEIFAVINNNSNGEQSFIHRDFGIAANLDVEIPLYGRVGNINFNDTLEFDLGSNLSQIDSLTIKTNMESYFPANAYLQVYFLDEDYSLTDSLYSGGFDLPLIAAPELGADGRPLSDEALLTTKEANVIPSTINNIVNSKYIVLKYSFESANFDDEANVKIFEDYYINAKVGFQATGKIDF
jgi:hypothetical protein